MNDPTSIVLTQDDYDRFGKKRKYISSKMMTYFAEYPVFILGYGLGDENVTNIISDLGEAMRDKGGFLENVYYICWNPSASMTPDLPNEHTVAVEGGKLPPLRVKAVYTDSLAWLLEVLGDMASPVPVNPKILRHLAARVVDLVRTDIPRNNVDINYEHIESISKDPSELALILGINNVTNPNIDYPFTISMVAETLGYPSWQKMNPLILKANEHVGFNIREHDNKYHTKIKTGKSKNSETRKFSKSFVQLLQSLQ